MYGRQGDSNNTQPWSVRAEVTIRHGTPVTSESSQAPVGISSTVTDSGGVRMIYRWNTTSQSSPSPTIPVITTSGQSSVSSGSFGFQRGNILFTSTPPPKSTQGSFTIPRSGSSGNDEHTPSRGRGANFSDSGYNSERFSPNSYSSLPVRRPSQQYNRRCRSTCSIVLSAVDSADGSKGENYGKMTSNETVKHSYDNSWRHPSAYVFSRQQFTTVPEVCEDCPEDGASSAHGTHFCSSVKEEVATKSTTVSKDASSQTTDIESRESSSMVADKNKVRRRAAIGLGSLDEQKKKKPESRSPTTASETTSIGPSAESEKSDSSTKDDSAKRKSRTVHIDVYCTGSDDDENVDTSSENECETPMTVFENPDVKVTHTQVASNVLPRGFQDDKAFLKRATERRCDSFKHAPMRMPSIASSKGYDSDDVFSSLYPSQFSSYSALRDPDSAPWSAASSNVGIPFDYDSTIATSAKDTLSDIESLINTKTDLTRCDSFEYASSTDRERIRKMEEIWAKEEEKEKRWRSPQVERKYLLRNRRMREYLKKDVEVEWSSGDSDEESDESGAIGWSFMSGKENQEGIKKTSSFRRSSKSIAEDGERNSSIMEKEVSKQKNSQQYHSDSTRSDSIPHTFRDQIGLFGSKTPSPLPSKVPSRVTSPFMTPQGERTDHILKASIFGTVVNAFRKPGHHIGPSKNPSCSCEHCQRYFEELNSRERSRSISDFERQMGFRLKNEKRIFRPIPKNDNS